MRIKKLTLVSFEDWSDFINAQLVRQLVDKLEALEVIEANLTVEQLESILGSSQQ